MQCFSSPFHWFIYEQNFYKNRILNYFANISLNVDVDISYINFGQWCYIESDKHYKMFDVYNNGFQQGGKLKVVFDRHLVITKNDSIYFTKSMVSPKISKRKNFSDLTLRVGLHVS